MFLSVILGILFNIYSYVKNHWQFAAPQKDTIPFNSNNTKNAIHSIFFLQCFFPERPKTKMKKYNDFDVRNSGMEPNATSTTLIVVA